MNSNLTTATNMHYAGGKCLKTRLHSGMSPRQSVAFFTPIASYGRGGVEIQDPQGKSHSLGCVRVFNTRAHPICLKTNGVDFLKSHTGARHVKSHLQLCFFQCSQSKQSNISHQCGDFKSTWLRSQRQSDSTLRTQQSRIYAVDVRDPQFEVVGKSANRNSHLQPTWRASVSHVCQNHQGGRISSLGVGRAGKTNLTSLASRPDGGIAFGALANDLPKRECGAQPRATRCPSVSARGNTFLYRKNHERAKNAVAVDYFGVRKTARYAGLNQSQINHLPPLVEGGACAGVR